MSLEFDSIEDAGDGHGALVMRDSAPANAVLTKLRQRYVDEVLVKQPRPSDRASWAVRSFLDAIDEAMR